MNIVILDGYTENPGDLSWDGFRAFGELTVYDRTDVRDTAEIIRRIGDAEIVFTNKTPVTREILDACPSIRMVGVLATGYNVVDTEAAREKGIPVTNIPAYGTASVGQFAIALLLELCHHIGAHDAAVKAGRWEHSADFCFWDYPLVELDGKTLGIIGFGRIGQTTGRIAKALGMQVLAYDTHETDSGRLIAEYVDLDTLLRTSDVIALHCPLFPETEGLINRETIGKMKDGALLINNSRGPLIVEQDVADALNSGKLAGAAVDVVSTEPIKGDNPLLTARNCIITPHMSCAAREARQRILDTSVEDVCIVLQGAPFHVVYLSRTSA